MANYQSAQYWKDFTNYRCDVQITPQSNSAVINFPEMAGAATYTLGIYSDKSYTNTVTELHLDANGNQMRAAQQTLSCTVFGLAANTKYYYLLTPRDANGYVLTAFEGDFTTASTNGIEDIVANHIALYPNPAKDEIFIKSDLSIKKIEICDLSGRFVGTENNSSFYNGMQTINISSLPQGFYLVKIHINSGMVVKKIVKE